MGIFDIFSKRDQEEPEDDGPLNYDEIPEEFRVQVYFILEEALCWFRPDEITENVHEILCKEYGMFSLSSRSLPDVEGRFGEIISFLMYTADVNRALDVVELFFRGIWSFEHLDRPRIPKNEGTTGRLFDEEGKKKKLKEQKKAAKEQKRRPPKNDILDPMSPKEACDELNDRFKEHKLGYRFEKGHIIRLDSEVIHEATTRPAFETLRGEVFAEANDALGRAYEGQRKGDRRACFASCREVLVETLRGIHASRGWPAPGEVTARTFMVSASKRGLLPRELFPLVDELVSLVEPRSKPPPRTSRVPGQRRTTVPPPAPPLDPDTMSPQLIGLVLHLTVTTMILLAQQAGAMDEG